MMQFNDEIKKNAKSLAQFVRVTAIILVTASLFVFMAGLYELVDHYNRLDSIIIGLVTCIMSSLFFIGCAKLIGGYNNFQEAINTGDEEKFAQSLPKIKMFWQMLLMALGVILLLFVLTFLFLIAGGFGR